MTSAQTTLYWREWGQLTKRCKKEGWNEPDRAALHLRALGYAKSSKELTNPEFDKILAVFRSYSQVENVSAQVRQQRQPRTRLEHAIVNERAAMLAVLIRVLGPDDTFDADSDVSGPEQLTLNDHERAESYIVRVMGQRFGTTNIQEISDEPNPERTGEKSDLECLRDTLDARITALRQKTPWTWHALRMRAGVPCDCATFCRGKAVTVNTSAPAEAVAA